MTEDPKLLDEYTAFVERMWFSGKDKPLELGIAVAQLGMAGETGEVTEIIKKYIRGDGFPDLNALKKELGDVIFYWTKIANYFGISLEDIILTNMEKLSSRRDRGVLRGNGDNR